MNLVKLPYKVLKADKRNRDGGEISEHSVKSKEAEKTKDKKQTSPNTRQEKQVENKKEIPKGYEENDLPADDPKGEPKIGGELKSSRHHHQHHHHHHHHHHNLTPTRQLGKVDVVFHTRQENSIRLSHIQLTPPINKTEKEGISKLNKPLKENDEPNISMTTVSGEENFQKDIEKLPSIGPLNITDLNEFLVKSKIDFDYMYNDKSNCSLNIKDFDLIKMLGSGTFGRVVLGQHKEENVFYAIKIIDKKGVVERHHIRYVSNEKRILQGLNFPFVIYLKYFFTDFYFLYYVLPYIPGGDFSDYLHKFKSLTESKAKFYVGQLVLALEYLHYLELIHRDLKPQNIMMDASGYIKLADFGQCVRCYGTDKTWTFTGTMEYMAPEIIERKGYDCAVDWWALGVITFEICAGYRPFTHKEPYKLHLFILSNKYSPPKHFSNPLKKLIKNIFVSDPKKRIANYFKKASEIKSHEWFKELDWLALLNRTLKAPLVPQLSHI